MSGSSAEGEHTTVVDQSLRVPASLVLVKYGMGVVWQIWAMWIGDVWACLSGVGSGRDAGSIPPPHTTADAASPRMGVTASHHTHASYARLRLRRMALGLSQRLFI